MNKRNRRHGESWINGKPTPEYLAWCSMRQRCMNPRARKYPLYGGRGVTVYEAWRKDFPAFLRDVGRRPGPGYSLDRINPYGNYEPTNVRWADAITQRHNRRENVVVVIP